MDKLSEEQLQKEHYEWIVNGVKQHKVFFYPDELFDRLRPYSYGGLPVSILLFTVEMNNGNCYNRSLLMQLAFDDCKRIHADIESLRQRYGDGEAEHSYIETKDFGGNTTYVVDTSVGLIFEKEYFDEHEKPKVNRVFTKEECMRSPDIADVLASDFEQDKWSLVLTLPLIEEAIENSDRLATVIYRDKLKDEIAKLKEAIDYDAMQREVEEDMRLMASNPKALDEKFQIVRDKYGREISRGGVKNPYYVKIKPKDLVPISELGKIERDFHLDYKTFRRSLQIFERERKETEDRANKRLKEIAKNPAQNVYDQPGED